MWRIALLEKAKVWFRNWHDKKITMLLIGSGSSIILGVLLSPWWVEPLIQAINEKFGFHISLPENNVDYILIFTATAVGLLLIRWGIQYRIRIKHKNKRMVQIRHSSVEGASYTSLFDDLDDYDVIPITIDQFQEMKELNEFNIKAAWMKQDHIVPILQVHMNDPSLDEISYFGMAHIPFQFLLGYQVADKIDIRFFEWIRDEKHWRSLSTENNVGFPPLNLTVNQQNQPLEEAKEIVIKIGITFEIFDEQLQGHNLEGLNSYYLKLGQPHIEAVKSKKQLNAYKATFRSLLTDIHHKYPKLNKVHLFISAQPSVVFTFGSCISDRMDSTKQFWIYNFIGSSMIKYPWALKIAKNLKDGEVKIKNRVE